MTDGSKIGLDNPAFSGRLRARPHVTSNYRPAPRSLNNLDSTPQPQLSAPMAVQNSTAQALGPAPTIGERSQLPPQPKPAQQQFQQPQQSAPFVPSPPEPISAQPDDAQPSFAATQFSQPAQPKNNRNRSKALIFGLAFTIFAAGIFVSINTLRTNGQVQAQLSAMTNSGSTTTQAPKATAVLGTTIKTPTSTTTYIPSPIQPKILKIPKFQSSAAVEPVTLNASNSIAAPVDSKNVGWYDQVNKPAANANLMIMNGAVGKAGQPGAFEQIGKLALNDTVQIVRGDDKVMSYTVVKIINFDPATTDISSLLVSSKQGVATLDLVTTGSTANGYDNATGLIVYAEQQI